MKFAIGFLSGTIITIFAAGNLVLGAMGYSLLMEHQQAKKVNKTEE